MIVAPFLAAVGTLTAEASGGVLIRPKNIPSITTIAECNGCDVKLTYDIFGLAEKVTLDHISEFAIATPFSDTKFDVVKRGRTNQAEGSCRKALLFHDQCTLVATFRITDGDPSDANDPDDDSGVWLVGISVPWTATDSNGVRTTGIANSGLRFIAVVDRSVPEPSTWGLMALGVGAVGAGLRRRRSAVA